MAESGIDIGYDLSALLTDDFDIESAIDFDDLLGTPKNQEYYELTSKTIPVSESTPNLKTANPLSRTQLKLQLMRDHAILEQQRQIQERLLTTPQPEKDGVQHSPRQSIKVPLQTLANVPPQVLQVQTKLENPTKYHVIEKQKTQVKQFLSESFQSTGNNLMLREKLINNNQPHSAPTRIVPPSSVPSAVPNNISQSQPYYTKGNVSPNYDVSALSPALSSGATSTSENA
ncbi:hypothetical protein NQ315_015078, partial [Exocentrus adspersus]